MDAIMLERLETLKNRMNYYKKKFKGMMSLQTSSFILQIIRKLDN